MPQLSKLLQSRDEWKCKAVQRGDEIRERRKSQKRYQETIAELKSQVRAMEQADADKKNGASGQPTQTSLR